MTTPDDTTGGTAMDVHRLLDEAFADVEMTPERQDLKEEVRTNLLARVTELQAGGIPGGVAARRAIDELGDIHAIVGNAEPPAVGAQGAATTQWQQHRVRLRPDFVLRTVLLSALAVAGLAMVALTATIGGLPTGVEVAAALTVAATAGVITTDSLRQETTTNHPMPTGRAAGYGAGALLAMAGFGSGWLFLRDPGLGWAIGGAVPVLVAAGLISYLGATQTNRHKEWVLRMAETHAVVGNRFTEDPSAAARFGVYTVVIWLIAIAGFVVLALTVGRTWSWLAIVGGVVVMMILLARMLFAPAPRHR